MESFASLRRSSIVHPFGGGYFLDPKQEFRDERSQRICRAGVSGVAWSATNSSSISFVAFRSSSVVISQYGLPEAFRLIFVPSPIGLLFMARQADGRASCGS